MGDQPMRTLRAGIVVAFMLVCASLAHAVPPVFLEKGVESDSQKAKAAADAYRVDEAVALYTKVLESPNLTPEERATALTGRAEARENHTVAFGIKDSEMLLALADYQEARKLWRTSRTLGNEAGAFITLGGYPEATATFAQAVPIERPDPHWSIIGLARVQRIQGHYDAALKHLDEALRYVEAEGGTMPVYYHRGRVFYLAGKFTEAADAFSKGIPIQPDYAFARKLRACAYAQLGDYTKAVADAEEAVKLFNATPGPAEEAWLKTPYGQATTKDFQTNLAAIKAMSAAKDVEANRARLCKNTWNDGEEKRDRSPLLPAPNPAASAS
jgi:tetratricopeptide (TPR) repeat protein